jgi:hypothetical protein
MGALRAWRTTYRRRSRRSPLDEAAFGFAEMIEPGALETDDALGLGGLLFDAVRVMQLGISGDLQGLLLAVAGPGTVTRTSTT